jgi:hypothetical protein
VPKLDGPIYKGIFSTLYDELDYLPLPFTIVEFLLRAIAVFISYIFPIRDTLSSRIVHCTITAVVGTVFLNKLQIIVQ